MCFQSWDRAANPVNIKSGFRCTGIIIFDRNIFGEEEFLSSPVTDRPMPKAIDVPFTYTATVGPRTPSYIPSTSSTTSIRLVANANMSSACSTIRTLTKPNNASVLT